MTCFPTRRKTSRHLQKVICCELIHVCLLPDLQHDTTINKLARQKLLFQDPLTHVINKNRRLSLYFLYSRPEKHSYSRLIWKYEQGDYIKLRANTSTTYLDALVDNEIDVYALNITAKILEIAKKYIIFQAK